MQLRIPNTPLAFGSPVCVRLYVSIRMCWTPWRLTNEASGKMTDAVMHRNTTRQRHRKGRHPGAKRGACLLCCPRSVLPVVHAVPDNNAGSLVEIITEWQAPCPSP